MSEKEKETGNEKEKKKLFGGKKTGKAPKKSKSSTKRYLNLVQDDSKEKNKKTILYVLLGVLVFAIFVKFGILDQLSKVQAAKSAFSEKEAELTIIQAKNQEYDEIKKEYDKLTEWYMTEAEKAEIDKINVFKMMEEDIFEFTGINSIKTEGNTVTVQTEITNLKTVSDFLTKLQADSRNGFVTVTTANANNGKDERTNNIIATLLITYEGGTGPGEVNENLEGTETSTEEKITITDENGNEVVVENQNTETNTEGNTETTEQTQPTAAPETATPTGTVSAMDD